MRSIQLVSVKNETKQQTKQKWGAKVFSMSRSRRGKRQSQDCRAPLVSVPRCWLTTTAEHILSARLWSGNRRYSGEQNDKSLTVVELTLEWEEADSRCIGNMSHDVQHTADNLSQVKVIGRAEEQLRALYTVTNDGSWIQWYSEKAEAELSRSQGNSMPDQGTAL